MKKLSFILMGLLLACPILKAQISKGGKPYSYAANLAPDVNTKTVPAVSLANLRKEDVLHEKQGLPLRIGIIFPVSYSLNNAGTWNTLPNGDRIWRLKIDVQGALATSLYYQDFHLPEGATLFVYNEDHSQLIGSFTSANNEQTGLFATEILKGNISIVEYYEPVAVKGQGRFTISGVNNIYSDKIPESKTVKTVGASGSCNVNVNCPEGANWQNQKRAVARIVLKLGSASYLCTGAVVNNARSDCKPYFLTASHCGSDASASDFNQWIFYFNYESPSCTNPGSEPASNTITGCVQRARAGESGDAEGSDFQLLEFNQAIPASYNVFYSGWSAATAASPSGVSIHHPAGDIKKISTYSATLTDDNFSGVGTTPTHWRAVWVQTQTNWSITEGGSSGSPLFNNVGQIVGQLSGGPSSCTATSANKYDLYGKVARSWTSNGTDALHQLKPWLDPDNTGVLQINGTNYPCGDTTHPTVCPDPYEPNNTLATAYTITSATDIRATINTASDTDYFKIVIADTSKVRIILDNLAANFNLRLLSSSGAQLAISQNSGTAADSIIYNNALGTYYIQVYGNSGVTYDSICYRLNATVTGLSSCTDQMEPNNTLATAAGISTGTNIRSQISTATDLDYYKFTTTGTNAIQIRLDSLPGDYDVKLFSSAGTQVGISQQSGTTAEVINYTAAAGTYYVEVYGYGSAFSNIKCYLLRASLTPVTACTDAFEPNESRTAAAAISVNTAINAQIASSSDVDWYSFSNTSSQPHIEILLSNLAGDYDVYLYNASGTQVGSSLNGDTASERIVLNNAAVGTYTVRIIGYNGASSTTKCYKLTANISSSPKQAITAKNSKVAGSGIHVYPVPARDKLYAEVTGQSNQLEYLIITDINGKVLYKQPYSVVVGYNRLEVSLPESLKAGVYIISDGKHSQKFVLQR
jgi:hypothetical protein